MDKKIAAYYVCRYALENCRKAFRAMEESGSHPGLTCGDVRRQIKDIDQAVSHLEDSIRLDGDAHSSGGGSHD